MTKEEKEVILNRNPHSYCPSDSIETLRLNLIQARNDVHGLLSALIKLEERAEALERALNGYCWACSHSKKAFPELPESTAVTCNVFKNRRIVGAVGCAGKDCEHWQFDQARFVGEAE